MVLGTGKLLFEFELSNQSSTIFWMNLLAHWGTLCHTLEENSAPITHFRKYSSLARGMHMFVQGYLIQVKRLVLRSFEYFSVSFRRFCSIKEKENQITLFSHYSKIKYRIHWAAYKSSFVVNSCKKWISFGLACRMQNPFIDLEFHSSSGKKIIRRDEYSHIQSIVFQ